MTFLCPERTPPESCIVGQVGNSRRGVCIECGQEYRAKTLVSNSWGTFASEWVLEDGDEA